MGCDLGIGPETIGSGDQCIWNVLREIEDSDQKVRMMGIVMGTNPSRNEKGLSIRAKSLILLWRPQGETLLTTVVYPEWPLLGFFI